MQDKGKRVRVERGLYVKAGVYYATAADANGKQQWQSLGAVNLSAARKARDEWVAGIRKQTVTRGKASFASVADEWIAQQAELRDIGEIRESTYRRYENSLRLYVKPHFGSRPVHKITADDVVSWHRSEQARTNAKGKPQSKASIRHHWMALRGVLGYAARHGYVASNVTDLLTRRERPKPGDKRVRYLESAEIGQLIDATTNRYRPSILMAIFLGVRLSELIAIRWRDVSFAEGVVHITGQIEGGERVDYAKTAAGYREVVLMDSLASALKAHKLASPWSLPDDYVTASRVGSPMNPRNLAQRGLEQAATTAKLDGVTFHVLRHTFASILIAQGHDPAYVAAQLGHEKPSVTLDTYSHLFNRARSADKHRTMLDGEFGHLFEVKSRVK